MPRQENGVMRQFESGATRNVDSSKPDPEGFLSPLVIHRFNEYMNKNRIQADGNVRASDNWQKGIPIDAYMKSGFRHFLDWWAAHRSTTVVSDEHLEESLCALMFNVMGYLHEQLKYKHNKMSTLNANMTNTSSGLLGSMGALLSRSAI